MQPEGKAMLTPEELHEIEFGVWTEETLRQALGEERRVMLQAERDEERERMRREYDALAEGPVTEAP